MSKPAPPQIAAIDAFAREAVAVLGRIEVILLRHEAQAVVELEIVDGRPEPHPPILRRVRVRGPDGALISRVEAVPLRDYHDATVHVRCPDGFGVREVHVADCIVHSATGDLLPTFSTGVGEIRGGWPVVAIVESTRL